MELLLQAAAYRRSIPYGNKKENRQSGKPAIGSCTDSQHIERTPGATAAPKALVTHPFVIRRRSFIYPNLRGSWHPYRAR
jgi:hypothetical protein